MSKWIDFIEENHPGVKTKIFGIVPKGIDGVCLGHIKWYGPWRCYCFYPLPQTIFEKTCIKDIISFIENLMLERKLEKQKLTT